MYNKVQKTDLDYFTFTLCKNLTKYLSVIYNETRLFSRITEKNLRIPTNRLRPPIGCLKSYSSLIGLISTLRHEEKTRSCCDWTRNPSGCKIAEKRIQVVVGRRPSDPACLVYGELGYEAAVQRFW